MQNFNARIRNLKIFEPVDKIEPGPFREIKCLNTDKAAADLSRGRKLIEFCESQSMIIPNGLQDHEKHFCSEYTCIRHNGRSVVDYAIAHKDFFL